MSNRSKDGSTTRERGNRAEDIASEHLSRLGYRIIERNFVCKLGEIDIVAAHNNEIVFVEVRSRHSAKALDPVFSVNRRKQQKIIQTAHVYLASRFRKTPAARFDVVLVTLGQPPHVEVIPDAFYAE